jgi:hypothetical protein
LEFDVPRRRARSKVQDHDRLSAAILLPAIQETSMLTPRLFGVLNRFGAGIPQNGIA